MFGYRRFDKQIPDETESDSDFASDQSSDYSDSDIEISEKQIPVLTSDEIHFRNRPEDYQRFEGLVNPLKSGYKRLIEKSEEEENEVLEDIKRLFTDKSENMFVSRHETHETFEGLENLFHETPVNTSNYPDYDKPYFSGLGYDIAGFIGKGAFGSVYKGICNENAKKVYPLGRFATQGSIGNRVFKIGGQRFEERSLTGKAFAAKLINMSPDRAQEGEANMLALVKHRNIIEMYHSEVIENKRLYIFMEYLPSGTLSDYFANCRANNHRISEDEMKDLFIQLTDALKYLHDRGIVHRDIHNGNILVSNDTNSDRLVLKLADFGLALQTTAPIRMQSDLLNLRYVFEDLFNITNFVNHDFQTQVRNCIQNLEFPNYQSLNDMIRDNHWLYPKYLRNPLLWFPRPTFL